MRCDYDRWIWIMRLKQKVLTWRHLEAVFLSALKYRKFQWRLTNGNGVSALQTCRHQVVSQRRRCVARPREGSATSKRDETRAGAPTRGKDHLTSPESLPRHSSRASRACRPGKSYLYSTSGGSRQAGQGTPSPLHLTATIQYYTRCSDRPIAIAIAI